LSFKIIAINGEDLETARSPMNDLADRPLNGAEEIGREAGLLDAEGNVDLNRVYYALAHGHLPASKRGRIWISTRNRIRRAYLGETATA
jgi:hypothetical protein